MSAIASIPANDGEVSPVTHTFDPKRIDGDVAFWENRVSGIPVGYERLSLGVVPPTKNNQLFKVRLRGAFPVMEVLNSATYSGIYPAPTKAFENGFDVTLFCPARGTEQQRKNMRYLLRDILGNTICIQAIEKLANVW